MMKYVCLQEAGKALTKFEKYHHVWKLDREEVLKDLQERSPGVDEFEQIILSYQSLSDEINTEPEYLLVGVIAVYTGTL